jgi:hypothetical protein
VRTDQIINRTVSAAIWQLARSNPNMARASFISVLQASGVDVATAAKLAGHKTPNVTLQYTLTRYMTAGKR